MRTNRNTPVLGFDISAPDEDAACCITARTARTPESPPWASSHPARTPLHRGRFARDAPHRRGRALVPGRPDSCSPRPFEPAGAVGTRKLRALIAVKDVRSGQPECVLEGLRTTPPVQGHRDRPRQHRPAEPIQPCDQGDTPRMEPERGEVRAPDLMPLGIGTPRNTSGSRRRSGCG